MTNALRIDAADEYTILLQGITVGPLTKLLLPRLLHLSGNLGTITEQWTKYIYLSQFHIIIGLVIGQVRHGASQSA